MTDYVSALEKEIKVIGFNDLDIKLCDTGAKGSRTKVKAVSTVIRKKKNTEFTDGSDSAAAASSILKEVKG